MPPRTVSASLRPLFYPSFALALLLTAADLSTGAHGGVLLFAAFLGACLLAIEGRISRAVTASEPLAIACLRPKTKRRLPVRDGGCITHPTAFDDKQEGE